jgi:DNA-directed RNA polymerase subunit RPC12/RpoP
MIIVCSRDGGYISQDCVKCGKSYRIAKTEIPIIKCPRCDSQDLVFVDKNTRGNYIYSCTRCGKKRVIASIIPTWQEAGMPEHGLGINNDNY